MLNKSTVNKVILMGNIGGGVTWQENDGQMFLCFPLITTERVKVNGEQQPHHEVHQIRVPSHLAVDNLAEGSIIYVQGRLQTKMFLDANRVKHYRSEIVAISVEPVELKVPIA